MNVLILQSSTLALEEILEQMSSGGFDDSVTVLMTDNDSFDVKGLPVNSSFIRLSAGRFDRVEPDCTDFKKLQRQNFDRIVILANDLFKNYYSGVLALARRINIDSTAKIIFCDAVGRKLSANFINVWVVLPFIKKTRPFLLWLFDYLTIFYFMVKSSRE